MPEGKRSASQIDLGVKEGPVFVPFYNAFEEEAVTDFRGVDLLRKEPLVLFVH
jgi:hypothetical protein